MTKDIFFSKVRSVATRSQSQTADYTPCVLYIPSKICAKHNIKKGDTILIHDFTILRDHTEPRYI